MVRDSLDRRYGYKLLSNLFALSATIAIQDFVPRGLGPKAYGDFNFLTNFFTQVVGFLDMGTSIGFCTKLSQRPNESSLIKFCSALVARMQDDFQAVSGSSPDTLWMRPSSDSQGSH